MTDEYLKASVDDAMAPAYSQAFWPMVALPRLQATGYRARGWWTRKDPSAKVWWALAAWYCCMILVAVWGAWMRARRG